MKKFLEFVITNIVDQPESVNITETEHDSGSLTYTISVNQEDMGKIIGKNGKMIRAIRTLTKVIAIKQNKYINVNLEE